MNRFLRWLRGRFAPPREPTPIEYVRAKQGPPPPEGEIAPRRWEALLPRLPTDLATLYTSGKLAVGDIATMHVDAYTEPVGREGYAIFLHTGLSRFLYRISRLVHTQVRIFDGANVEAQDVTQPSMTFAETVSLLEAVYRNYMRTGTITGKPYVISRAQVELASQLAVHAETFVMAHEAAHVAIWRRGSPDAPLSPQEELDADALAVRYVFGVDGPARALDGMSARMAYAGVEFACRAVAGLEHLGHKFTESHPLPSVRLTGIRQAAVALLGRRQFLDISTIAMAHDQLLEEMERRLVSDETARTFVLGLTLDRVLSTLSVIVAELGHERMDLAFAIRELESVFKLAPDAVVHASALEASAMYKQGAERAAGEEAGSGVVEFAAFVQIAEAIADPWRTILRDAISGNPDPGAAPSVDRQH